MNKVVIVCGPTASGKTVFAHALAERYNGEIVNADSMQIYRQLPIITASPPDRLTQQLPYHLYNFQDIQEEFSAVKYVQIAGQIISGITQRKRLPIIVGGSGLYINMLMYGYNNMPDITPENRTKARELHQLLGAEEFFNQLQNLDPQSSLLLHPSDKQRTIRAYEIALQTGKSIVEYQQQAKISPLSGFDIQVLLLMPERKMLYESCNTRFCKLFAEAMDEIKNIHKLQIDKNLSSMKALGVAEIIDYLEGKLSAEQAIELATTKTRQYAKRQCTWFNNQIKNKKIITFNNLDEYNDILNSLPIN